MSMKASGRPPASLRPGEPDHRRERRAATWREIDERFLVAFESAPIGMALAGHDGRLQRLNAAFMRLLGAFSESEILGRDFRALTHPEDAPAELALVHRLLDGEIDSYDMELRHVRPDGIAVPVLVSVSLARDGQGRPQQYIVQAQDLSERERHTGRLRHLSDRDPLTGLPNRRRFVQEVARQLAHVKRYGGPSTFVMLDLEELAYCRQSFGPSIANELLRLVCDAAHRSVRSPDLLARVGDNQLGVLLPATDEELAHRMAQQLVALVGCQLLHASGRDIGLSATASVMALKTGPALGEEDLLISAELAVEEGSEGAARVSRGTVARPAPERVMLSTWLGRIRHALDRGSFVLHYQPIVALDTGEISHYEALVRLDDRPDGRLVAPGRFLAAAERYGMIGDIDRVVISQVMALMNDPATPAGLRVAVNLSARSTNDEGMLAYIADQIERHSVDPARLIVEITETAAISDMEHAKSFCDAVERLGCAVALDDFGAGFGSFYYVKHLPFSYLKIDGDFISTLTKSPADKLVVKALVDIARGMGKQTIAEFVGDQPTMVLLRDFGVDYAQGYEVGEPRPSAEAFSAVT